MEVKVIGTNCSNGIKLSKLVQRAIKNIETNITLQELNDEKSKKHYNIQNVPGLVINDKLICQGKVLTEREITKLLA